MLNQITLDQLRALKLLAFADGLQQQMSQPDTLAMSFEERLALLVDRELAARSDRKRIRLLQRANLKYPDAAIENAEFSDIRGMDRRTLTSLALSGWVERGDTILISGATGVGKSWLACALGHKACREGYSVLYLRLTRLWRELAVARGDGRYLKLLAGLLRMDLIILDDLGTEALGEAERHDLLEILEDRYERRSTLVTSQLPVAHWHETIGDPTLADAILDRLVHNAHKLALKGESMRKKLKGPAGSD